MIKTGLKTREETVDQQHFRHNQRERAPRTRRGHREMTRTFSEAAQFERELDEKLDRLTTILDGKPTMLNRALTKATFGHIPKGPSLKAYDGKPIALSDAEGHFARVPTLSAFLARGERAFAHMPDRVRLK